MKIRLNDIIGNLTEYVATGSVVFMSTGGGGRRVSSSNLPALLSKYRGRIQRLMRRDRRGIAK